MCSRIWEMSHYECSLSLELLEKAVTELNEPRDNNERLKAIDQLRESYKEEKYGPLKSKDDKFILKFLRAKKFNKQKALKVLQNYHKNRRNFSEVFEHYENTVTMQEMSDRNFVEFIDNGGSDGSCVVWEKSGLFPPGLDIYAVTAYRVLMAEKHLENEQNQICGFQSVTDFANFNISIIAQHPPNTPARINAVWQDAMPLRVKSMHIINEGRVIDIVMSICKVFMKEKLFKRIKLHGTDRSRLKEFVRQDIYSSFCSIAETS